MRRAFVSHSTADDSYVAEMESFLRAAGCDDVFNDASAIKPDEQFWPAIEKGITACDTFVVVITAAATNSEWVRREVALARRLGKRVIPIWREDCPLPRDFADRDVIDFRPRARAERRFDISRITKYAPADLIGRADETKLLADAWQKTLRLEPGRPHVLTFVALGGEGKTSLVAKWAATLAGDNWPGCDAAFAWSFYSQGTRERLAASSDLFLKEALNFFATGTKEEVAEIKAFAASAAGAFEKGQRLARLVGQRRSLLILDGLEPLQYAPTSTAHPPGELKDQGVAALLKGLAAASHGLCVVTTRYSLPDLNAFLGRTVFEEKLTRLSRKHGVDLLKKLGVHGSELRNIFLDLPSPIEAPKRAIYDSPGQRPGLVAQQDSSALKGRDKSGGCDAPIGHNDLEDAGTQGVALGCPIAGRWPARSDDGRELVNEYEKLVEDVKGHALTLALLGGFLKRAFHGDIRQRDRVQFEKADEKMDGGHAFRTMAAYEQWLLRDGGEEGRREVAVLRLMGLFDRPADAGCLAALRREPIPGLTEPLAGLADDDWEFCLSGLETAKLLTVNRDASGALVSLDAHPLLREYFARQLHTQQTDAWRAAHRRLYEHLCATTPDKPQPTLEDLQPLYQAVAHGCQAGLCEKALRIYQERIERSNQYYCTYRYGAFGLNLAALACFFPKPFEEVHEQLTNADRAFLLKNAGFHLRALGRIGEALRVLEKAWGLFSTSIDVDLEEGAYLGGIYANTLKLVGNLSLAADVSEKSVDLGKRWDHELKKHTLSVTPITPQDGIQLRGQELVVHQLCNFGDILHYMGRTTEAKTAFSEAESRYQEWILSKRGFNRPDTLLCGNDGFKYWNLLLTLGEHREVRERTKAVSANNPGIFIREEHQALAWCCHGQAIMALGGSHSSEEVEKYLDGALNSLRSVCGEDLKPFGLLALAQFYANSQNGHVKARELLDEAREIAERGLMKLHLADIHLHRARLFFREKEYPKTWISPQADLAAARKLIEQCGYWRRQEELEDAEKVIGV